MNVELLTQERVPGVMQLMARGEPFIRVRTESDYWLYARLFSTTCPIAMDDGTVVGAVIAFRSQDDPDDMYVQDVMVDPDHRRQGVARQLIGHVRERAASWGCRRLYLTSEPDNPAAHHAWLTLGFANVPSEKSIEGVWVIPDFKGPGKDRAVYELRI